MPWIQVIKGAQVTFPLKNDEFEVIELSPSYVHAAKAIEQEDDRVVVSLFDGVNLKFHVFVGVLQANDINVDEIDIVKLKSAHKELNKAQKEFIGVLMDNFADFKPKVKEGVFLVKLD